MEELKAKYRPQFLDYDFEKDFDILLSHTLPHSELKKWLEEMHADITRARKLMLTKSGSNWKKAKKRLVGANLVLSDLTDRFNLK